MQCLTQTLSDPPKKVSSQVKEAALRPDGIWKTPMGDAKLINNPIKRIVTNMNVSLLPVALKSQPFKVNANDKLYDTRSFAGTTTVDLQSMAPFPT